jgi:hypothetical protein
VPGPCTGRKNTAGIKKSLLNALYKKCTNIHIKPGIEKLSTFFFVAVYGLGFMYTSSIPPFIVETVINRLIPANLLQQ